MRSFRGLALLFALTASFSCGVEATELPTFTATDARSLPTPQLASELLGERLGRRVIEAKRYEYPGSSGSVPQFVEFFTQPELSSPVINGICRTDVITIEYDWVHQANASSSAPLKIARIAARSKYKSFPELSGERGSEAYDRARAASCAAMKTASDAFPAPTAGDAQWLIAMRKEYANPAARFAFSCDDFADRSCGKAREVLQSLQLNAAKDIQVVECPKIKTGNDVDFCYLLTFDYPTERRFPDIADYDEPAHPQWLVTVFAGMRDGMAPVKIRSLQIEHRPKSYGIP